MSIQDQWRLLGYTVPSILAEMLCNGYEGDPTGSDKRMGPASLDHFFCAICAWQLDPDYVINFIVK